MGEQAERTGLGPGDGASPALGGARCPRCLAPLALDGAARVCAGCGAAYEPGPRPGTISIGGPEATFAQELDAWVPSGLEEMLDALDAPSCTERAIAAFAEEHGVVIGNPVWEGRADVARTLPQSAGVALDVGCGFGTNTIALARSARHVLALDRSPARVRLTAARARAEGLENVTTIHADGLPLPVGTETCDLVTVIGVLEWMSLGSPDPVATQREALAEVARVLRPGGALLLGIENRYAAHYFAGFREEHVDLPFVSLLPRRLADVYTRRAQGRPFTTYTHSRRGLEQLLREAGLSPRLAVALPSYGQPQYSFDADDFGSAWPFYLRHVYHHSSPSRRVVGHLVARAPGWAATFAPGFWVVARKGPSPGRLPTVVTGTADCHGTIKTIEWSRREITRRPRLGAGASSVEPLLDGWSARRWLTAPIRASKRRARELAILHAASRLLAERPRRPADEEVVERCLAQAERALELLRPRIGAEASAWCSREVGVLAEDPGDAVFEHGDFVTGNLLVGRDGEVAALDPAREWALAGRDSVLLVLDLFALRRGAKHPDVELGLEALAAAAAGADRAAAEAARLLGGELEVGADHRRAARLMLLAVLRHCEARGSLPGAAGFATRASQGELGVLVRRLAHRGAREA